MKPLCKKIAPDYAPPAVKTLNQGDCGCTQEEVDPRWAELLKIEK